MNKWDQKKIETTRFDSTDFPAYSHTGYSDTTVTVTVLTGPFPYWRIFGRKDPIFSSRTFPNCIVVPVAQRMSQQAANNLQATGNTIHNK